MEKSGLCLGIKHIAAGLCTSCLTVVLLCFGSTTVYAEKSEDHGFSIEAELLPGSDSETYDISLLVSSSKTDLEGTVRLSINNGYYEEACAYDTAITLPKDSEKRFTVQISERALRSSNTISGYGNEGEVCVQVLDHKGKKLAEKKFKHLLEDERSTLSMGILSDQYSNLTYLDLGGETIYFFGSNYPIRLTELEEDTLNDQLPRLDILVIDAFNSASLSDEQLKAIDLWIDDGGCLIVGTGNYVEKSLDHLDDLIGIEYAGYIIPGTEDDNAWNYPYYQFDMAILDDSYGSYVQDSESYMFVRSRGSGAVGVLPYSLSEVWEKGMRTDKVAYDVLDRGINYVSGGYQNKRDDILQYRGRNLMGIMNNSTSSLNFSVLNVIVFFYVLFVGPVLYLILRIVKKREAYWIAVPAAALVFVLIVSLAGRGFEVKDARVLSVSVARADGRGRKQSFLQCYNAGHQEWMLKMAEEYDCASPTFIETYRYVEDEGEYTYHVRKDGESISIGANPSENFEDIFYYALAKNQENSSIGASNIDLNTPYHYRGIVTNETDHDFVYVAVMADDKLLIYGSLGAGEQLDIASEDLLYEFTVTSADDVGYHFVYDVLYDVYSGSNKDITASRRLAALGMGAGMLSGNESAFAMGLVEDYDNTIDDRCSELSYGCLYTPIN